MVDATATAQDDEMALGGRVARRHDSSGCANHLRNWQEIVIDTNAGPGENLSIPPIKLIPAAAKCKHPQVRVVARDEDTEFVECQQCGEVFDAIEYRDMMLEEEDLKKAVDETP